MTETRRTPQFQIFGEPPPAYEKVGIIENAQCTQWNVAQETPVAFVYNRRNFAVMLATPLNLDDFAVGFSITEKIAQHPGQIDSVEIHYKERGVELHLELTQERLACLDVRQQRRNLVGRAGCGLCGLESAETLFETLPLVSENQVSIASEVLARAVAQLGGYQSLNEITHSVHGAAWVGFDGSIRLVREDVGRHNALDKVLGAILLSGEDPATGFILMSSRCSYEIVEKAARGGLTAIASLSAPTVFAIQKARQANISLYCQSKDGFIKVES